MLLEKDSASLCRCNQIQPGVLNSNYKSALTSDQSRSHNPKDMQQLVVYSNCWCVFDVWLVHAVGVQLASIAPDRPEIRHTTDPGLVRLLLILLDACDRGMPQPAQPAKPCADRFIKEDRRWRTVRLPDSPQWGRWPQLTYTDQKN